VWQHCAALTLRLARELPEVHTVNLGGGFKVARAPGEEDTDLQQVGKAIEKQLRRFQAEDNERRGLHLEIEPGTFLTARAGAIVSTIIDLKETSDYRFIIVDSGMTDNLRPALYGAQHALRVVHAQDLDGALAATEDDFLVSGHCCESGDLLTPAPGDPEGLAPRRLPQPRIGDALVMGDTGAYSTSMAAVNYNSFPQSAVLLRAPDGALHVIRRRQTWQEMTAAEQVPALTEALAQIKRRAGWPRND
jgi:diaminopimelate decarboxylase